MSAVAAGVSPAEAQQMPAGCNPILAIPARDHDGSHRISARAFAVLWGWDSRASRREMRARILAIRN